jgi:hypothetical protein
MSASILSLALCSGLLLTMFGGAHRGRRRARLLGHAGPRVAW